MTEEQRQRLLQQCDALLAVVKEILGAGETDLPEQRHPEDDGVDDLECDDEGVPYGLLCKCGHTYGEHGAQNDVCLYPDGHLQQRSCFCNGFRPAASKRQAPAVWRLYNINQLRRRHDLHQVPR